MRGPLLWDQTEWISADNFLLIIMLKKNDWIRECQGESCIITSVTLRSLEFLMLSRIWTLQCPWPLNVFLIINMVFRTLLHWTPQHVLQVQFWALTRQWRWSGALPKPPSWAGRPWRAPRGNGLVAAAPTTPQRSSSARLPKAPQGSPETLERPGCIQPQLTSLYVHGVVRTGFPGEEGCLVSCLTLLALDVGILVLDGYHQLNSQKLPLMLFAEGSLFSHWNKVYSLSSGVNMAKADTVLHSPVAWCPVSAKSIPVKLFV